MLIRGASLQILSASNMPDPPTKPRLELFLDILYKTAASKITAAKMRNFGTFMLSVWFDEFMGFLLF
jgi:hypothetical protein